MSLRKSSTYANIIEMGGQLGIYYISRIKDLSKDTAWLDVQAIEIGTDLSKDKLIAILEAGGLKVRFFDKEEKNWMETSKGNGVRVVKGHRDGQWSMPTLEEFEEQYLGKV